MFGLGDDGAVGEAVQDAAAHRRVGLGELVVGLLQAVLGHRAGGGAHHEPGEGPTDRRGDPLVAGDLVVGLAEDVLRDDVHAAAVRQVGLGGVVAGVDGDVHRRVAHAEHDDLLAGELLLLLVGVGVDLLAGEGVGAGEAGLGQARVPVVAVGDHDRAVAAGLAGGQSYVEASAGQGLNVRDTGVEGDLGAEAEVVDVVVEVLGDLVVAREVREVLRHGEVAELHAAARGVDVQRLVRRRDAVAVAPHPVAADAVGELEAVERDPALVQDLRGGDARRAGPDDADAFGLVDGQGVGLCAGARRHGTPVPGRCDQWSCDQWSL